MAPSYGPFYGLLAEFWASLEVKLPDLCLYLGVQVAAFVPCLILVKRTWPKHKDHWSLADTLVSLGIFPALTMSALLAVGDLRHDVQSRWHGQTPESRFFFLLYITRSSMHIFMQCMENMSRSLFLMMTAHHIFSLVCFGVGLLTGRMHFWGCLDGCCEMSTIFLNNLYLSKEITIGGRDLKELIPNWLFGLNGFLLWLSFLVFRIALFPYWLHTWYTDVMTDPASTWERSNFVEKYGYASVTAFLFFLSSFWFVNVTKGMLKALGLSGRSKKEKNGKEE